MASDTQTSRTDLIGYLTETLASAKINREHLDAKWIRNYGDYQCDDTYRAETWKQKEKARTSKSRTIFDVVRQKCQAAHNLITDVLFRGGRVPLMLSVDERGVAIQTEEDTIALQSAVDANEDILDAQHKHTDAVGEISRCILDGAVYGEYIAKSYVTDMVDEFWSAHAPGVLVKRSTARTVKAVERVAPWNIWRDMEAKDIRRGRYVFHRDPINLDKIAEMFGVPFHLPWAIRRAIEQQGVVASTGTGADVAAESSAPQSQPPVERDLANRTNPLELFEFWGRVPKAKALRFEDAIRAEAIAFPEIGLAEMGITDVPEGESDGTDGGVVEEATTVNVFVKFIGDEIIAYRREPGPMPFFREEWEQALDGTHGRGLADNLAAHQVTLTGCTRSFENNAKLLSNLILAIKRGALKNSKALAGVMEEGGVLEMEGETEAKLADIVQQLNLSPTVLEPLLKGLELFLQFADLSSNLPRAEQGQQSDNPQTAFELQQRLERSGKYLADVIRRVDRLIEWTGQVEYDWNMGDPTVPKVPAIVKPLGFTSFENRYLRMQRLLQALTMALNAPALGDMTNVRWMWEEVLKGLDIEVDQALLSVETMQAKAEPNPLVGVQAEALAAKADKDRADADTKRIKAAVDLERMRQEADQTTALMMRRPVMGGLQG